MNVLRPRSKCPQSDYRATIVKEGATIGANATIICGIWIGKHAFIGAGAVVIGCIPAYSLAIGVPAEVVGKVNEKGDKE